MKGISEIIATILMLMITLAISGTAYIFISGAFTQQTQGLEVVDAFCQQVAPYPIVNIIMRNLGTSEISAPAVTVTQTNPQDDQDGAGPLGPADPNKVWTGGVTSIAPGTTTTLTDACEGSGPRSCIYRILPPAGRSIVASISCS